MNTLPYAIAHIDGELDCDSLVVGVLDSPERTPAVYFQVTAGAQSHTVYATDYPAKQVYCYCFTAKDNGQHHIEINVAANLVSAEWMTYPFASKIIWHTSSRIRIQAEEMIAAMNGNGKSNGHGRGNSRKDQWPSSDILKIPPTNKS